MSVQNSRFDLADNLNICRIINGMWQVSGSHGYIEQGKAIHSMMQYHDAGLTSWDMADIYGPAEDFFGEFRHVVKQKRDSTQLEEIQAFTKWVPNPQKITRQLVQDSISESLQKMNVPSIDLLQFHWWDYQNKDYLTALDYLTELTDEGKISHLALTNFDTQKMQEIVDHGIKIISNQVQYSVIDSRPQKEMEQFCKKYGISLLAYGTVCGGLLSEKYLHRNEPSRYDLNTASLQKYKNMIDAWGGWDLLQKLLNILDDIAKKHSCSITNVATRIILDRPCVAGVIIGTRLGVSEHIQDNLAVFDLTLDSEDIQRINQITCDSKDLFEIIGDCGSEYR